MRPSVEDTPPLSAPGPRWWRRTLAVLGASYLAAIFLGSSGSRLPREMLPAPVLTFTQVACLFPLAATHTIEYRLSAFSCDRDQYLELDHRPHFPLHPDDKENRFHRLGHFYRRDARVMRALEDYVVERHNRLTLTSATAPDGIDGPIGGILMSSLRIPVPPVGSPIERYTPLKASEVAPDWRKAWYRTPHERARQRCEERR